MIMIEEARERIEGVSPPVLRGRWRLFVGLGAAFWVAGLLLWAQQIGDDSLDQAALFFFDPLRRGDNGMMSVAGWLTSYGMVAIALVYSLLAVLGHRLPRLEIPAALFLLTLISFGVSGLLGDLLKEVFDRPRPLAAYGEAVVVLSEATTPALPSGHATKSLALALPMVVLGLGRVPFRQGLQGLVLALAAGVGLSRVMLGAHYLSDVLAGMGTALVGLPLAVVVADRIMRRVKPEKMPKMRLVWGIILIVLAFLLTLM
jgi:undecaprenyl-diphosphatase